MGFTGRDSFNLCSNDLLSRVEVAISVACEGMKQSPRRDSGGCQQTSESCHLNKKDKTGEVVEGYFKSYMRFSSAGSPAHAYSTAILHPTQGKYHCGLNLARRLPECPPPEMASAALSCIMHDNDAPMFLASFQLAASGAELKQLSILRLFFNVQHRVLAQLGMVR